MEKKKSVNKKNNKKVLGTTATLGTESGQELSGKTHRLLHLNLVDFNAEEFMSEVVIEVEAVSVLHVFASGVFIKYAGFPTCQGLQRASQLALL